MTDPRIYLDHAATAPLRPLARAAIERVWDSGVGNAASLHTEGRTAARILDDARAQIAALVGARPDEVFLTAGATESSNIAIRGTAQAGQARGGHAVVSTRIEHSAGKRACEALALEGWRVTLLRPDSWGFVDPDGLAQAIKPDTSLVSVIAGHNELGTLQPLHALAEVAHAIGALIHIDAVQAAAYIAIGNVPWDLASISAHKLGGPQGIGALVVRGPELPWPVLVGGAQEAGLRPGTVAVALAAGFGAAAQAALAEREHERNRLAALRDRLANGIGEQCPMVRPIGAWRDRPEQALPQIATFGIEDLRGDELVYALDELGVAASSSAACIGDTRSHVLDAIGLAERIGVMRLSLGWNTDAQMIDVAIERVTRAVTELSSRAPFERRRRIVAAQADLAGVVMTAAHWDMAEAIFEFHRKEGVLPGVRFMKQALRVENRPERLFPDGMRTLAKWLGIAIPQGGCRPGGV